MSEFVHPRRAKLDALDDGDGPYMESFTLQGPPEHWDEFKVWAADWLGQGFSLACVDGHIIDPMTWAYYQGFRGGRKQ